jgi:pyruvate/2-oxoglutarate dehydrogenase complex dihydrolipoamide acyltransferase (E2) component
LNVAVRLTQWSMGMREGLVVAVSVHEGDLVAEGDPLLEVEAEKTTDVIAAPLAGRVVAVHVAAGDEVPVGAQLVTIEPAG